MRPIAAITLVTALPGLAPAPAALAQGHRPPPPPENRPHLKEKKRRGDRPRRKSTATESQLTTRLGA